MTTNVKTYGYHEALLGETKSQKELIKEANRNYENPRTGIWMLNIWNR